jgi:hypothetical protein
MTTKEHTINTLVTNIDSDAFLAGFVEGQTDGIQHERFSVVDGPATEAGLVEVVRNLCEVFQEGWLTDEQLRHDVGLLAGWLLREVKPHLIPLMS